MGPFLYIAVWGLVIAGFVQIFLPFNRVADLAIAVVGALVFCAYTVFDTYLIFNRLSPEDYIIAAVELYLDLLNMFLYILRILNDLNRN
ncbi:Transmembrane BAX inhibitor motif-containing protein 4 [Gonapodya sp. JEL0774]|nr:Transmembrane BAX inhibitor motif-containing protein 4 [Gonapodya sp. JEL0774]